MGAYHLSKQCPDRCTSSCEQLEALSGRVRPESTIKGCGEYHQTSQHQCRTCFEIGVDHVSNNCPDRSKTEEPNQRRCSECTKVGHTAVECLQFVYHLKGLNKMNVSTRY